MEGVPPRSRTKTRLIFLEEEEEEEERKKEETGRRRDEEERAPDKGSLEPFRIRRCTLREGISPSLYPVRLRTRPFVFRPEEQTRLAPYENYGIKRTGALSGNFLFTLDASRRARARA